MKREYPWNIWFTFKILVIFPLSLIYVIAIWSSWVNTITTNYSNTHPDTRLSSLLTEKLLCSSARKSCFLAFGNCGVLTLTQTNKQTNNKISDWTTYSINKITILIAICRILNIDTIVLDNMTSNTRLISQLTSKVVLAQHLWWHFFQQEKWASQSPFYSGNNHKQIILRFIEEATDTLCRSQTKMSSSPEQ